MNVAMINMVSFGSTGRIMMQIADNVRFHGGKALTYSTIQPGKKFQKKPDDTDYHHYYGSYLSNTVHYARARISGAYGFYSRKITRKLIRDLDSFNPDIVHLHNLHGSYLYLPYLFNYLRERKIHVVWTLHDCWAITGRCPYFQVAKCTKWINGCGKCNYPSGSYPASVIDNSSKYWELKKDLFTGIKGLKIVTPSKWLSSIVKKSYLKDYDISVINNGIDTTTFEPSCSRFRVDHGISDDKKIILGVSLSWNYYKGLDVFCSLADRLDDSFVIVLVGVTEEQAQLLSPRIICIQKTHNQKELAEIYSASDLFVNPTREEVLGLVNLEALACGTPVITFNTGGSPETIDHSCGIVVPCDDIDELEFSIRKATNNEMFSPSNCVKRAAQFDAKNKYEEYYKLYEELLDKK